MKRFISAISAGALAFAVVGSYAQGKKDDGRSSSSSNQSSRSGSSANQGSSSRSQGSQGMGSSSRGQSQGMGSSSRAQGGSSQYGSPDRGGQPSGFPQSGPNYRGQGSRGDSSQYGSPDRGRSQSGLPQSSGSNGRGQGSKGDFNPYGAPTRGGAPTGFPQSSGSNYRGQGSKGDPPPKSEPPTQGGGRAAPPKGEGGGKASPPTGGIGGGRGNSNPPADQGTPPTRTGSDKAPPQRIGPPVQIGPRPTMGGGLAPAKQDGPIFNSRTGGTKPADKNHNLTGPKPAVQIGGTSGSPNRGAGGPSGIPVRINNNSNNSFRWKVWAIEDYRSSLRYGYYSYNPNWCDWWFGYRYYFFNPSPFNCVFSPYYGYYSVPAYLSLARCFVGRPTVIVVYGDPYRWNYCGRGTSYNFYSTYYDSGRANYSPIDVAVSDLSDAFKYGDEKLLDRLVARDGQVEIFIDNEYAYSMNADDYYDITSDLIKSVATTNFSIVSVKRAQQGGYVVTARHDYRDSWNVEQTNWLTFTLREDRGRYSITQAGTSKLRPDF